MNDWAQRIRDLEGAGWSLTRLAGEIGLAVSSVSDLKNGLSKEPRGMAAVKLHELHGRECAPVTDGGARAA